MSTLPCLGCRGMDRITLLRLFRTSATPCVFFAELCALCSSGFPPVEEPFQGRTQAALVFQLFRASVDQSVFFCSGSTVDFHLLRSFSSGQSQPKPTLAWLPPCSHNADILCSTPLLSIVFYCTALHLERVGWFVPETSSVWQSARLQVCTAIQYCSAGTTENIVQPVQLKILLSNTILFSNLLKYTLVGYKRLVR